MSGTEETPPLPAVPGPRIPAELRGKQRKRRQPSDGRGLVWFGMLLLGVVVGAAFYRFSPFVSDSFDALVTTALR